MITSRRLFHCSHLIALAIVGCLIVNSANAAPIVLTDRNATVTVDPQPAANDPAGMIAWEVDGVNHLAQQWFYYRTGNNPEQEIHNLPLAGVIASNGDFHPGNERVLMRYGTADTFYITVDYLLAGGLPGSGASDLAEVISIDNNSNETLRMSFFQYSDFDVANNVIDGSINVTGGNTARQVSTSGLTVSETVVTPMPTLSEVALSPNTFAKLNDGNADNLDGSTSLNGPGDYTWTFQWDITLSPGGSFLISKDKHIGGGIIPEPATLGLLGLSLLAITRRRTA